MDIEGVKLQIANILGSGDWSGKKSRAELTTAKKPVRADEKEETQPNQKGEKQRLSPEEIKEVQARINEALRHMNYQIKLYIDKPTGRIAAEIIDKETNEVIREIPEKELLKLAAKIRQMTENVFEHYA
ncbi:MAG: hypothetical protein A3G93_04025 [Nitrospinae bacterium RIFCSPLOWO2_12_FULL_45_22]|nr:MAG: hypothetical protein A3G93_04025 [Nitrospinae bacterium RIFCSPLOWO2_12_FULL_45_22]